MSSWISLLNGISVTLYGSILSASFCNAFSNRRNRRIFYLCIAAILLIQGCLSYLFGDEFLRLIYPLTIHLPLALVLYFISGKILWSAACVLTAYLCCELRRWIALLVVVLVSGGDLLQDAVELVLTLPLLLLLLRFVLPAVRRVGNHAVKTQCRFGVIPALYYIFDYATVVYTDMLVNGGPVVVEFMPFVCCAAYLVFLLYNAGKEAKHAQLQQVQKNLDLQIKQSVREISALRESQTLARQYRHDLRHHLQYVFSCIENGQGEQAQSYISGVCKEIESQKVDQFCENEAANLILSAFANRAKKDGIMMNVHGALPAFVLVSDSDLCVLLSNALENALHACQNISDTGTARTIDVQFYTKADKLFLQITNPCENEVRFEKDIPVSDHPEHGIGVQSICTIVKRYGGVCSFSVQEGQFILRLSI